MNGSAKYFIVEAETMPEIFRKVAEAKRLLETGEETTVNNAVKTVGISRSAFYKYKDSVRPFNDMLHGRIVTFQILLKDEPGVLSLVSGMFARYGVSIASMVQKGWVDIGHAANLLTYENDKNIVIKAKHMIKNSDF